MIKKFIEKFKQNRQFKRDMVDWIRLCRVTRKSDWTMGIRKAGVLTHKIEIEGVGKIESREPIFIKE